MSHGWLEGKVALITGGGSGIGRAVVDAYLEEGARIVVLEFDHDKCRELERLGDRVVSVHGDATTTEANVRAVAFAVGTFGQLDVLATFVGVFDGYTSLLDIPDERFDGAFGETFDVNVRSVLLAVRAGASALRARAGTIIITASSSSFYAGRGGTLYVASKFALRGVVLQLAHELAPAIRVNGVAPGGTVDTDLRGLRSLGQHGTRLDDRPGRAAGIRERTPLNVAMTGAEHAGAYVLLASERSRGMTGEMLRSDGGMAIR
jgi:NAD(P)-dependent dehydrogenase (short-subunit alcohol dehydrogenase family)